MRKKLTCAAITEAQVIEAMRDLIAIRRDGSPTARIRAEVNAKRVKDGRIPTRVVYDRLVKLEQAGKVKRVRRAFHPHFGWSLVEA